ncbi:MAG: 50S ribosomal protein L14e [Candidatus Altiarchaeales archaeon]|nr:MAG: 50S ribosomal protein L14e [Candidatus Altiarchaeales archaeon]
MIMEVGRVCRKVRGKDAGKYCVVVERIDKNFVLIDGKEMKRKKTNVLHLEPLPKVLDIKKGAATEDVIKELEKENFA